MVVVGGGVVFASWDIIFFIAVAAAAAAVTGLVDVGILTVLYGCESTYIYIYIALGALSLVCTPRCGWLRARYPRVSPTCRRTRVKVLVRRIPPIFMGAPRRRTTPDDVEKTKKKSKLKRARGLVIRARERVAAAARRKCEMAAASDGCVWAAAGRWK